MDEDIDFTQPWAHGDVTFIVEGCRLYANKVTLSMWSCVMNAMFTGNFKEKDAAEIELPNKKFQDVLELMKVVHPPNKDIDGTIVRQILPLAEEFQMGRVKSRCEAFMLTHLPSIKNLVLADSFDLRALREESLKYARVVPLTELRAEPEFKHLQPATLIELLTHKLTVYETGAEDEVTRRHWECWCPSNDEELRHFVGSQGGCLHCQKYEMYHSNTNPQAGSKAVNF